MANGYVYIRNKEHPFRSQRNYVAEHRLVMEKKLGRYLSPNEEPHHINETKTDNRAENLEVTLHGEHTAYHNKRRKVNSR